MALPPPLAPPPHTQSILVEVDLASGKEVRRLPDIGVKSHGLVFWEHFIVGLNSDEGQLIRVQPDKGTWERLWSVSCG
jgi:hypothetical protein